MQFDEINYSTLKSSADKRKYWRSAIEDFNKTALNQKSFCADKGINLSLFRKWRYRLMKLATIDGDNKKFSKNTFIPIDIKEPTIKTTSTFSKKHHDDIKILLNADMVLSIPTDFNEVTLKRLIDLFC